MLTTDTVFVLLVLDFNIWLFSSEFQCFMGSTLFYTAHWRTYTTGTLQVLQKSCLLSFFTLNIWTMLPVIIFYFEHIHFRNGKYSSENLWTTTFSVRLDRRNRGPVCGDGGHVGHCCRRILRRQHLELPGDHLHPQHRHHDHNHYHRGL